MNLTSSCSGIDVGLGPATSHRHLLTCSLEPHFIFIQDDPVLRPQQSQSQLWEFLLPESYKLTFPLRERALGGAGLRFPLQYPQLVTFLEDQ